MKYALATCLVILTTTIMAAAQAPAVAAAAASVVPPDFIVVQQSWRATVRNPALDADPFEANTEFTDALRAQRATDAQNTVRGRSGESREPTPPRRNTTASAAPTVPATTTVTYTYTAKVKNTGAKIITAVAWAYLFTDPVTQKEVGRHRHISKIKIRPGQESKLSARSAIPPTYTVNAKTAGRKPDQQFTEQIVIYRLEYDDGSVWQVPAP